MRSSGGLRTVLYLISLTAFTCAIFFLTQFLLAFPFRWLHSALHLSDTLAQSLYSFTNYAVTIALIIVLPGRINKKLKLSLADLGIKELPTWTDIGLAPVGFIAYVVLAAFVTGIFAGIFPWFDANQAQNTGFDNVVFGTDRFLALTALVIVAPIAEEIIFRGFLYGRLKKKLQDSAKDQPSQAQDAKSRQHRRKHPEFPAIAIATLLTSIAFGVMHGQWNVGVNVFVMSIVLCAMREITGSIYASILMHILKNAIAFYLLYLTAFSF